MLDSEVGELHRQLGEEVEGLYGALNTREGSGRTSHKSCDATSCTATAEFQSLAIERVKGARLLMAASFRESGDPARKGN